jgi:hypothetical protein
MNLNKPYALGVSGITPRVVSTWSPSVRRSPRVLVPIHLDALVVRQAGGQWARCGMQTPVGPDDTPVDISQFLSPPFENLSGPRPKGAYLHWALPDALTRGAQDPTTGALATSFPAVPDRWLVLRLHPSRAVANRRTIRGWILQAGDANPQPLPLDTWVEPGGPPAGVKEPLTALGHGDVSWSAYYDNVVDRLAFYDDLADVSTGPLAYLVCGWYSDDGLDPVGDESIHSLTDFNKKMDSLRWSLTEKDFKEAVKKAERYINSASSAGLRTEAGFAERLRAVTVLGNKMFRASGGMPEGPPYVTDGSWWPQNTLYHGSVVGIGWPGIGWPGNEKGVLSEETGGPPAASSLKVVVGNTGAEALAELVERANNSSDEARLLEAFQIGATGELDQPDGRARLDSLLHARAFGSQSGGETVERVWEPPSGPEPRPDVPTSKPPHGIFQRHFAGQRYRKSGQVLKSAQKDMPPYSVVQAQNFFSSKSLQKETHIYLGALDIMFDDVVPAQVETYKPGRWKDLTVALPRFFHPIDPVILVQGVKRSFRHGADGRYSPEGKLECRMTGTCVHEFVPWEGDLSKPPIYPDDVLDRGVENGSVPPECEELLGEVALLDPGSAAPVVSSGNSGKSLPAGEMAAQQRAVMVEQTSWWAMRDPRVDHGRLITRSKYSGRYPSPVAITPPSAPWIPLHIEWRVEYIPSATGVKDWRLGENDFNETVPNLPPAVGAPGVLIFQGRCPLTAGVNRTLAASIRNAVDQISRTGGSVNLAPETYLEAFASEIAGTLLGRISGRTVKNESDEKKAEFEDIATALESMDVVSATFNGLHRGLRGGFAQDGISTPADGVPPSPFVHLRAGFLKLLRLRLVDCFGQFIDLAGSSASTPADPARVMRTEPLEVTGRPELLALPPRFTAPARLWLRWMDAGGGFEEARLASDVASGVSPVCGYVMPDHLDRALEFFDAEGHAVGQVWLTENASVAWEDAPGRPAGLGSSPAAIVPNKFLGAIAQSLVDWGIADAGMAPGKDTALGGLLRVVDSALWSVDPFGHQSDEHLALLVGHPVAVVRALLRLELREPIDPPSAIVKEIPVRLGALAHWQDGLLGYFVNDDYNTLHCPDPAVAGFARRIGPNEGFLQQATLTDAYYNQFGADLPPGATEGAAPVDHPYIDTSGVIWVHPNQDVWLTMLVEPHTLVHATTGCLPRKDLGMRREWVKDALGRLAPTFRFGPVLIDPERIRMPIAHDIDGTWSWDHRTDVNIWASSPVTHATQDARLDPDPPEGSEGWLRLSPKSETPGG